MSGIELANFNLNLLAALDGLLGQRSVSADGSLDLDVYVKGCWRTRSAAPDSVT